MIPARLRGQLKSQLGHHPRLLATVRRTRRLAGSPVRWRRRRRTSHAKARAAARLVTSPVFVIGPSESGWPEFGALLDGHRDLRAPKELPLGSVHVDFDRRYAEFAMKELGVDRRELEHMVWDRVLHHELARTGKRVLLDGSTENAALYERLLDCWPNARFIFLLRHPASIVASVLDSGRESELKRAVDLTLEEVEAVEAARSALPGLVVRYEELSDDPVRVARQVCGYVGVRWDPRMAERGRSEGGDRRGAREWRIKVHAGPKPPRDPRPATAEVPVELEPVARAWGYLS